MPKRVRVVAPASLSNLGPGFDIIGLALHEPADVVEAELTEQTGVEIAGIAGDDGLLSREPHENVAAVAAADALQRMRQLEQRPAPRNGVRLWLRKGIPIASGLGGSAASSVAGAVAVNELFGRPLSREQLIESALAGEQVAAVSAHGDNIIPCLLGGIVLIRTLAPLDIVRLPVPAALHLAVVHPHCRVSTAQARAILRDVRYPLADVVANAANVAAFVAALNAGDLGLLGRSTVDRLVEPLRAPLVPGYDAVRRAAGACGAMACGISGSGPTMFAFAPDVSLATRCATAMRDAFREAAGLGSDEFVGRVNETGATVTVVEDAGAAPGSGIGARG